MRHWRRDILEFQERKSLCANPNPQSKGWPAKPGSPGALEQAANPTPAKISTRTLPRMAPPISQLPPWWTLRCPADLRSPGNRPNRQPSEAAIAPFTFARRDPSRNGTEGSLFTVGRCDISGGLTSIAERARHAPPPWSARQMAPQRAHALTPHARPRLVATVYISSTRP